MILSNEARRLLETPVHGHDISEVVGNSMGGFFCRRDKDGEERWWLEITGKGDKTRIVPATNELMVELAAIAG